MGLGGPMTWWPAGLCERLARQGFYVIRYDNRDTGRSSRSRVASVDAALVRGLVAAPRAPYTLSDMAATASACSTTSGSRSRTSSASRWAA